MDRFTISILVNNKFGVLNRVTSMFRRRQFNITSLTVSETESEAFSRITVLSEGDEVQKEQLKDQLYKLPDVVSIAELDGLDSVSRELALIKVKQNAENRADIRAACETCGGKIVDYTKDSVIIQMVGNTYKVNNFIEIMKEFEILEICRTGVVTLQRGSNTIRSKVRL